MKLPNGDRAVVDMRKLREYCLSTRHPRGRHKARVFASVLGVKDTDTELLYSALIHAASEEEAERGAEDKYGARYSVDFEMSGPAGKGVVRRFWIIRSGESFPRLTTCFVM
jgi:hypothetical protein